MTFSILLRLLAPFATGLTSVTSEGKRQSQMLRSFPVYGVTCTCPVVKPRSEFEIFLK